MVLISSRLLEDYGYTVTGVTDSNEILEKVRPDPQQFDLIISDQTMPGFSGSELAKAVLKIAPLMPFILCSADEEPLKKKINNHRRDANATSHYFTVRLRDS